jgi:hypothetical protein
MEKIGDGYYFMFEIGWFMDLLIPTIVKVRDNSIYFIGSKPCEDKNLKPCCMPCGDAEEIIKLLPDDPSAKAFKTHDSLVPINDAENLAGELKVCLDNKKLREKYLNTKAKAGREASIERIMSDYKVLSGMDG